MVGTSFLIITQTFRPLVILHWNLLSISYYSISVTSFFFSFQYEYWNTYRCNASKHRCKGNGISDLLLHVVAKPLHELNASIRVIFLEHPDVVCRGYPIGMENGKIPDDNIGASSWHEPFHSFRPEAGRLDNEDGVWCPNTLGEVDKKYYLQVEFPSRYNVCSVATQGSPLYDTDWVTKYRLEFSMDGQSFALYTENGIVKVRLTRFAQHGTQFVDSNLKIKGGSLFDRYWFTLINIDTRGGFFDTFCTGHVTNGNKKWRVYSRLY